jgi:Flp pilus assembly protein TadG
MAAMKRRGRPGDETGSELIEFMIVFPLFMLVVAAIADFGFLFQRYEVVTNAAREGARVAILPGYSATDVTARVTNYLTASGLTATPTVTQTLGSETIGTRTVGTVRVLVAYPSRYDFIGPFASFFAGPSWGTITLQASSVMRVEGGS